MKITAAWQILPTAAAYRATIIAVSVRLELPRKHTPRVPYFALAVKPPQRAHILYYLFDDCY